MVQCSYLQGEPALDVAVAARNAGFLKAQMARKMMAKSMARGKGESSQRPRKAAKVQLARDTESGRGRQRKPRIDHGMLMDDDWEPSHDSDSDYSSGDERGRGREEEAADADVQISSLEMLAEPQPPPFQPQEYVNRYRNGWSALQAAKAVQLEEVRMVGGVVFIPFHL